MMGDDLEFLLGFDGAGFVFDQGFHLRVRAKAVEATPERPYGVSYSLTLHGPDGARIMGFDNAHGVPAVGSRFKERPEAHDHWHRDASDTGRPYVFKSGAELVADFFAEVERVLAEHGVDPHNPSTEGYGDDEAED